MTKLLEDYRVSLSQRGLLLKKQVLGLGVLLDPGLQWEVWISSGHTASFISFGWYASNGCSSGSRIWPPWCMLWLHPGKLARYPLKAGKLPAMLAAFCQNSGVNRQKVVGQTGGCNYWLAVMSFLIWLRSMISCWGNKLTCIEVLDEC